MLPPRTAQITVCKSLIVVNIEILAVSDSVSTWRPTSALREFLLPLGTSRPRRTVNTAALLIQLIPNFKNIRADLRYADLLRRMGLPQSPLPTPS
jgi:hypothetical protein